MDVTLITAPSIIPTLTYPIPRATEEILEELWLQLSLYKLYYPEAPLEKLNMIAVGCHDRYPKLGEEIQNLVMYWIFIHL